MDKKFSLKAFEAAGMGTQAARALASQLEEAIQVRLHEGTMKAINELVWQLNQLGHNLTDYEEPAPGDISLRDDDGYICRLRLGVDTIVSTGFGDTSEPDAK